MNRSELANLILESEATGRTIQERHKKGEWYDYTGTFWVLDPDMDYEYRLAPVELNLERAMRVMRNLIEDPIAIRGANQIRLTVWTKDFKEAGDMVEEYYDALANEVEEDTTDSDW